MTKNIIILAAGASSRMKESLVGSSLSKEEIRTISSKSKALIGIGKSKRPFLDYLLFNIEKAGYVNVFLIIGESTGAFKRYYGNKTVGNSHGALRISYAIQYVQENSEKPFGTADALQQCIEQYPQLLKETFTICIADNLYSIDALESIRKEKTSNAFISYDRDGLQFSLERISKFAITVLDEEDYLIDIIEKPSAEEISALKTKSLEIRVSMNLWKLDGSQIYPYLKACPINHERNEKELPTAIYMMIKQLPTHLKGIHFKEHVPDLTTKADIAIVQKQISKYFIK